MLDRVLPSVCSVQSLEGLPFVEALPLLLFNTGPVVDIVIFEFFLVCLNTSYVHIKTIQAKYSLSLHCKNVGKTLHRSFKLNFFHLHD